MFVDVVIYGIDYTYAVYEHTVGFEIDEGGMSAFYLRMKSTCLDRLLEGLGVDDVLLVGGERFRWRGTVDTYNISLVVRDR